MGAWASGVALQRVRQGRLTSWAEDDDAKSRRKEEKAVEDWLYVRGEGQ